MPLDSDAAQLLTLIVVLTAGIGLATERFLGKRNNHRKLHNNPHGNPGDPDKIPLGDVTVGWWERKMNGYTEQIVKAIEKINES